MTIDRRQFLAGVTGAALAPMPQVAPPQNDRSLKITGVETFAVKNPPPTRGGKYWVFLKLLTDRGIVGYGEVDMQGIPFGPSAVEALIRDVVASSVVGWSPYR